MWKDFFYYSKSERRAVYALCIGIALLLIAIWMMPDVSKTLIAETPDVDSVALNSFEQEVLSKSYSKREKKRFVAEEIPMSLTAFDPNMADSIELSRLGLPVYVVRNILKYRQKGGRFKTTESFSRIYGLEPDLYERLKPYIRIAESKVAEAKKVDTIALEHVLLQKCRA